MPRVVIADQSHLFPRPPRAALCEAGVEVVDADPSGPSPALLRTAHGLLVFQLPLTAAEMEELKRCRIILRCGVGVDNIDLEAARARGIPVCNVPDYCTDDVADHTLALALSLARQIPVLDRSLRSQQWFDAPVASLLAFGQMTFGVVGFGRIGRSVLRRARTFHFRLAACDPYVGENALPPDITRMDLSQLLSEADIVSLHAPLTVETRHLIRQESLALMKPTAILINTARGGLVDTRALAGALRSGRLAAAGLDVFETEPLPPDHRLLRCPNALLTPHIAWNSSQSLPRLFSQAAVELLNGLRGHRLRSCVNGVPSRAPVLD